MCPWVLLPKQAHIHQPDTSSHPIPSLAYTQGLQLSQGISYNPREQYKAFKPGKHRLTIIMMQALTTTSLNFTWNTQRAPPTSPMRVYKTLLHCWPRSLSQQQTRFSNSDTALNSACGSIKSLFVPGCVGQKKQDEEKPSFGSTVQLYTKCWPPRLRFTV